MNKDIRYVEWSDGFKVNIKVIDKQHKHFIEIMNELFKAMQSSEKTAVPKLIVELANYAELHFMTEQKLFEKYNFPQTQKHVDEHKKIQAEVARFVNRSKQCCDNQTDLFKLGYDLLDLLEDWLFKHLATWDVKYAKFLQEQGVK